MLILCLSGLSSCCRHGYQGVDVGRACLRSEPLGDGQHELSVDLRVDGLDLLQVDHASCDVELVDGELVIESVVNGVDSCKESESGSRMDPIECGAVVVPEGQVTAVFGYGELVVQVPTEMAECFEPYLDVALGDDGPGFP